MRRCPAGGKLVSTIDGSPNPSQGSAIGRKANEIAHTFEAVNEMASTAHSHIDTYPQHFSFTICNKPPVLLFRAGSLVPSWGGRHA